VLQVQNLQKSYAVTTVLDGVSFVLNDGEHLGLIGANGTGKSTLLRCLVGDEQPDRGSITLDPRNTRIGYLPQAFGAGESRTLDQVVREHAEEWRAREVLDGLQLGNLEPSTPVATLSGGQKTRLGLATLLLSDPDVLLLDEPTNHLDVDALEWLEHFLSSYSHAVLLVSHDRAFLDATVSRILFLDPDTRTVRSYVGGYTDFAAARAHERELHLQTWRRQEEYVQHVRGDINRLKTEARAIEVSTTPRQPGIRRHARRKAAVAKSRERKLERYLASDERVERPRARWPINLDLNHGSPSASRVMLRCEDVGFGYPGKPPLFEHVNLEVRYGQRLGLVGPNGSGKTTLLRLLSGELAPNTGRVQPGAAVNLGVMAQEHETLDPRLSVLETVLRERPMSEQDARSFLPYFLFYGDSVFNGRRVLARRAEPTPVGEAGAAGLQSVAAGRADQPPRRRLARAL
jgi:ATP-binding cassette subfamily F protein 3